MFEVLERYAKDDKVEISFNNSIFDDIKNEIIANNNKLENANKGDNTNYNYQLNIDNLVGKIDKYKDYDCDISEQNQIVVYTGDPELTLELLMQSLLKHKRVLLIFSEYMHSLNDVIFTIFDNVLLKYNIKNLFYHIPKVTSQLIYELNTLKEEIVVIGDSYLEQTLKNNKFYPYKNYVMYCDDEKFDELKKYVFYYTTKARYELEVIYEDNIDYVIDEVNYSLADTFILFSSNEEVIDKVKKEVKDKKLYINKNPFKEKDNSIIFYI